MNRWVILGIAVVIGAVLSIAMCSSTPVPAPTRTPFTISDEELAKLTDEDMAKTEAHKQQLEKEVMSSIDTVGAVAVLQGATLTDAAQATAEAKVAFAQYKKETQQTISTLLAYKTKYAAKAAKLKLVGAVGNVIILALAGVIVLKIPAVGIYVGGIGAVIASAAWWTWILI